MDLHRKLHLSARTFLETNPPKMYFCVGADVHLGSVWGRTCILAILCRGGRASWPFAKREECRCLSRVGIGG